MVNDEETLDRVGLLIILVAIIGIAVAVWNGDRIVEVLDIGLKWIITGLAAIAGIPAIIELLKNR